MSLSCRHGNPHPFLLCPWFALSQLGRGIQKSDSGGKEITSRADQPGAMLAASGIRSVRCIFMPVASLIVALLRIRNLD